MNVSAEKPSAILLISSPDRRGIIAAVTDFLKRCEGNIINLEEHVDEPEKMFFMRVEWELDGFCLDRQEISKRFALVAEPFQMDWRIYFSDYTPRMAIMVSKYEHCLHDILARVSSNEWDVEIPLVISNHPDLRPVAERLGIDYHVMPINRENKKAQEQRELELFRKHQIDFIVMARYMQILSANFISVYPNRIINIHHSFLPAFAGARPYQSALKRGVKLIGATSHYATADLDEGPIIEQDVVPVSHRDGLNDLLRKGRDVEKIVLARAIGDHLDRRVLTYKNRTIVFS